MTANKPAKPPTVFIGSSSESEEEARALRFQLDAVADVTFWREAFPAGSMTLVELLDLSRQFDFGVFLLSADDATTSRGASHLSPRDNVLLELGLFLGNIGRERTIIVYDTTTMPKRPSDLEGLTFATYRHGSHAGNVKSVMGSAGDEIRRIVSALGPREAENRALPAQVAGSSVSDPPVRAHSASGIHVSAAATAAQAELLPDPTSARDFRTLVDGWPRFVESFANISPAAVPLLRESFPIYLNRGRLVMSFRSEFGLARIRSSPTVRERIENAICDVLRLDSGSITITPVSEGPDRPADGAPPDAPLHRPR